VEKIMEIHLPAPPVKKRKGLTIAQLSQRWRKRTAYVRHVLKQAGIQVVPVEQPPTEGVLFADLLKFEQSIRQKQEDTSCPF
jgi:hypothetical protein